MKTAFTVISVLILLALSSILLPSCSGEREAVIVRAISGKSSVLYWEVEHVGKNLHTYVDWEMEVMGASVGDTLLISEWDKKPFAFKPAKK